MSKIIKYKLYIDVVPTQTSLFGASVVTGVTLNNNGVHYMIKHADGTLHNSAKNDFYVNIPFFRTERVYEYTDLQIDDFTYTIERQEFNPFFIEYDFFNTITRGRINSGNSLDSDNIDFIRKVTDVDSDFPVSNEPFVYKNYSLTSDERIRFWYDEYGQYQFPWNEGMYNETTKDDLDRSSQNTKGIVSKSTIYSIDINK